MRKLLLASCWLFTLPLSATAQNASPTSPVQFKVLAVGGFLGQLDGFCEPPGSTFDLGFIKRPEVLSCAGADGQLQKDKWPVAMGGLLGARTWIDDEKADKSTTPLVLIPGNNQIANFTFIDRQKVLAQAAAIAVAPARVDSSQSRAEQTLGRFQRFWQEMAKVDADAIGLAVEDFVRSLRDPREDTSTTIKDRGSILQRWLHLATMEGNHLPIIGSNAIVKASNPGGSINHIKADGFSLADIDEHTSVGWMTKIKVLHPSRAGIDLELWEDGPVGGDQAERFVSTTATKADAATELNIVDGTLRPGYRYEVRARDGNKLSTLTLQTHAALTPQKNTLGNLNGFPVVTKTLADGSPLMILSLVDPGVKALLGDAWEWKRAACVDGDYCQSEGGKQTCASEHCEIDFMSPADAVTAAIQRSFTKPTDRKPFIILLSALTDTQNEELLQKFPEIRLIILDPETYMLGRGSREYDPEQKPELEKRLSQRKDADQKYGGDLGMFGVSTGSRPQMTTMFARAEWIGEWGAVLEGKASYSDQFEWEITDPKIRVELIPGAALTWKGEPCLDKSDRDAGAECTAFEVHSRRKTGELDTLSYGQFVSYQVCEDKLDPDKHHPTPTVRDQCDIFSKLLNNGDFMALAGDAFRRATGSELAVVPGTLVDPDAQAWLKPIITRDATRVMTRFILERAIFRSFRIVRASVSGDQLVATLDKALKSPNYPRTCVLGIDGGCTTKVDPKKPDRVLANGRLIDSRSFYSIAMPEGLAKELNLPHSKKSHHTTDAVSAIHQRLIRDDDRGWYVEGQHDTLAPRLEARAKNAYQFQSLLSSFEFGYSDFSLAPDPRDVTDLAKQRSKQLSGLDVEFAGVKPSTKLTGKTDLDFAAADFRYFAVRALYNADLSRRLDYKTTGNELVFDKNTYTAGARFDVKLPLFKREVRTYVGRFVDGEIMGPPDYKTAKYTDTQGDGFAKTTTAKQPTMFDREPRRFRYGGYGIDVLNIWNIAPTSKHPLDIKKFTLQYAVGHINRVTGASIDGIKQDGDWSALGAQGVLDAYYNLKRDKFDPTVSFKSQEETRDQRRWQAELNFEPRLVLGSRTWKFGTELRYRRFPRPAEPSDLQYYFKAKLSFSFPITSRLEFVPSYEFHQANIHNEESTPFRHTKIEATIKLPFAVRGGLSWPGWLVR